MLITIQLAFNLTAQTPGPIGLPEGFPPLTSSDSTAPSATALEWDEKIIDDSGLHVRVAYPSDWAERSETGARLGELFRKTNGESQWLFDVGRPHPAPTNARINAPVPAASLQRFAEALTRSFAASNRAELRGEGQGSSRPRAIKPFR